MLGLGFCAYERKEVRVINIKGMCIGGHRYGSNIPYLRVRYKWHEDWAQAPQFFLLHPSSLSVSTNQIMCLAKGCIPESATTRLPWLIWEVIVKYNLLFLPSSFSTHILPWKIQDVSRSIEYETIAYSSCRPICLTGVENKVELVFGDSNCRVHNAKLVRNAAVIQSQYTRA